MNNRTMNNRITNHRKRNPIILAIATLSLLGTSLPATASPDQARQDITAKLEYCKGRETKAERRQCFKRVRRYCLDQYAPELCQQIFQEFKQSPMAEPQAALPMNQLN